MPWKTQALFIHPVRHPPIYPSAHPYPSTYLHSMHPHTPCLPTPTWLLTHLLSIHQLHLFSHPLECPIVHLPNPPPHLLTDLPNPTPAQVMYLIEEAQPSAGFSL